MRRRFRFHFRGQPASHHIDLVVQKSAHLSEKKQADGCISVSLNLVVFKTRAPNDRRSSNERRRTA